MSYADLPKHYQRGQTTHRHACTYSAQLYLYYLPPCYHRHHRISRDQHKPSERERVVNASPPLLWDPVSFLCMSPSYHLHPMLPSGPRLLASCACLWLSLLTSRQRQNSLRHKCWICHHCLLKPNLSCWISEPGDGIGTCPILLSIFDFSGLNHLPPGPRTSPEVSLAGCKPAPSFPWATCWHVPPLWHQRVKSLPNKTHLLFIQQNIYRAHYVLITKFSVLRVQSFRKKVKTCYLLEDEF